MSCVEEKGTELVVQTPEVMRVDTELDLMEMAERRVKWADSLIQRSMSRLRVADLCNIEGAPYIRASGAYAIGRLFGLRISYGGRTPQKTVGEDGNGRYYVYFMNAVVSMPNGLDSVEVIGACSSRDKFFAMKGGAFKPMEDIDEVNVALTCTTVADRKGILKLLGLTPTWDELARFAKISMQDVAAFSFKRPARSGPTTRHSDPASAPVENTAAQSGNQPEARTPATPTATPATVVDAASKPAEKSAEKTEEKTSLRQDALEAIKAYSAYTKTPLLQAVQKFTGKKSLGQVLDEALPKIIEEVVRATGETP